MSAPALLDQLAEVSRQIEQHRAAIFLLEIERLDLQNRMRAQQSKQDEVGP